MALLRAQRGLLAKIAKGLNITKQALSGWDRVPAERLAEVSRISGIPRHLLRPDVCEPPSRRSVRSQRVAGRAAC